jgi:1-acyl-sn-glycerol-3-phosphate acyltransferase
MMVKRSLGQRIKDALVWHAVIGSLRVILFFGASIRVVYFSRPPRQGPLILASNHVSHFDPPLITVSCPRRIDWIAMRQLFGTWWSKALFEGLNVIPVERGGSDRAALRTASSRLKDEGRVIGIFPEGGIRDSEASLLNGGPVREGVALLARLSGAPVVPCVIIGSDRLYNRRRWVFGRRAPVWVAFGEPFQPASREECASQLSQRIIEMKARLMREYGVKGEDLPQPPRQRMAEA